MLEVGEGLFQVGEGAIALPGFYDDVIDVDLQIAPDLSLKAGLHTPLVGAPPHSLIQMTSSHNRSI
jgi:hypothetical protein